MNELIVAADLRFRGYNVFRALDTDSPCDLVVLTLHEEGRLLRVEVKSGNLYERKVHVTFSAHKSIKFDILAAVLGSGEIVYDPVDRRQLDLPGDDN